MQPWNIVPDEAKDHELADYCKRDSNITIQMAQSARIEELAETNEELMETNRVLTKETSALSAEVSELQEAYNTIESLKAHNESLRKLNIVVNERKLEYAKSLTEARDSIENKDYAIESFQEIILEKEELLRYVQEQNLLLTSRIEKDSRTCLVSPTGRRVGRLTPEMQNLPPVNDTWTLEEIEEKILRKIDFASLEARMIRMMDDKIKRLEEDNSPLTSDPT